MDTAAAQVDTAVPVLKGEHRYISLDKVFASKTNPRTHFDKAKLQELADSVKAHGVLEPVMVRPAPGQPVASGHMELIFGERRWRAAKMVMLPEIPCIVKPMTDEQVCEVQVIENVQRDDLHPLEEARGYHELAHTFKHTIADIAGKVGKSPSYVRNRMKLLELEKTVQQRFLEGKLSPSVALLIARIPVKALQPKAAKECIEYGNGMRTETARSHIERRYMTDLAGAEFDTKDATLVVDAGACTECPKRTGNQPELFEDIKDGDVCTDPVCFKNKSEAHGQRIIIAARKAGQTVITGAAAKKIMPYAHSSASLGDGFVAVTDKPYQDPKKRTVRQLLGEGAKVTVVADPHNPGRVIEVVKQDQVKTALKNAGIKLGGPTAVKANPADYAREREEKTKQIIKRRVFDQVVAREAVRDDVDELRMVVGIILHGADYDARKHVGLIWSPDDGKKERTERQRYEAVTASLPRMDSATLWRLLRDLVLTGQLATYRDGQPLFESAVRHGVDVGGIRTLVRAERAPKKAKPAKPKKSTKAATPAPATKTKAKKVPAVKTTKKRSAK